MHDYSIAVCILILLWQQSVNMMPSTKYINSFSIVFKVAKLNISVS